MRKITITTSNTPATSVPVLFINKTKEAKMEDKPELQGVGATIEVNDEEELVTAKDPEIQKAEA